MALNIKSGEQPAQLGLRIGKNLTFDSSLVSCLHIKLYRADLYDYITY